MKKTISIYLLLLSSSVSFTMEENTKKKKPIKINVSIHQEITDGNGLITNTCGNSRIRNGFGVESAMTTCLSGPIAFTAGVLCCTGYVIPGLIVGTQVLTPCAIGCTGIAMTQNGENRVNKVIKKWYKPVDRCSTSKKITIKKSNVSSLLTFYDNISKYNLTHDQPGAPYKDSIEEKAINSLRKKTNSRNSNIFVYTHELASLAQAIRKRTYDDTFTYSPINIQDATLKVCKKRNKTENNIIFSKVVTSALIRHYFTQYNGNICIKLKPKCNIVYNN